MASGVVVPRWVLATAIGAPTVLVAFSVAARLMVGADYSPIGQTMSTLADTGRYGWIMTVGFVLSALCQVLTAFGLRILRPLARVALVVAGTCGLAVAALPSHLGATATAHLLAAGAGAIVLAIWPVLGISGAAFAPRACRTRWAVSASLVLFAMLVWVYYETQSGLVLGLSERFVVVAEMTWPLVIVMTAHHPAVDRDDDELQQSQNYSGQSEQSRSGFGRHQVAYPTDTGD